MSNVEPLRTEAMIAADLKEEIRLALMTVQALMDKAKQSGMQVQFNLGVDAFGRTKVDGLAIVKVVA